MFASCEVKSTEHPCARLPTVPTNEPYPSRVQKEPVNEPHFDCYLKNKTGITSTVIGKPVSHFEQSCSCKQLNQPGNPKTKPVRKYSAGRLKVKHVGSSLKNIVGLSQRATDGLQILQRTLWINQHQNQWIKQAAKKLIFNTKRLDLLEAEVQLIRQQYRKLELRLSYRKNIDILNETTTD